MEKYKIEFSKEQINLLQNIMESVYNRFCWSYHISKIAEHKTFCESNFNAMIEVATLMDEIYSQIKIQDGSKDI